MFIQRLNDDFKLKNSLYDIQIIDMPGCVKSLLIGTFMSMI